MKIGHLARQAGVNIQTVRYYERIGILRPPLRRESGYRDYDEDSLHKLRFIRRAQELGFTLDEIKDLLSLRTSSSRSREKARSKAKEKVADIRNKIADLKNLEANLKKLIHDCENGAVSGPCPILERMEFGK